MSEIKEEYKFPLYLFNAGKNYKAYELFGVHKIDTKSYAFRVWAPHAKAVSVVGDFNNCDENENKCECISP